MTKEVFVELFFVGALFSFFFWHRIVQFYRWLKGSRRSYYLDDGIIRELEPEKSYQGTISTTIIEITERLFWKRAMIHGKNSGRWIISKIEKNPMDGSHILFLQDRGGQSIETVLKAVNSGLSFPVLNDRIAELEREHKVDVAKFQEVSAAIIVLREQILSDKQRYRGTVALELRRDLQAVIDEADILAVSSEDECLKRWQDRFRQNRLNVS